jgi:hypothetical protein
MIRMSGLQWHLRYDISPSLFSGSSRDSFSNANFRVQLLAKVQPAPASAMSAAALQKLERIHVMKCAKDITGSDKPRKLAPKLRKEVRMNKNIIVLSSFVHLIHCAKFAFAGSQVCQPLHATCQGAFWFSVSDFRCRGALIFLLRTDFLGQTKALLAASAKELMSAAKTPAQKKDAQKVLAKVPSCVGLLFVHAALLCILCAFVLACLRACLRACVLACLRACSRYLACGLVGWRAYCWLMPPFESYYFAGSWRIQAGCQVCRRLQGCRARTHRGKGGQVQSDQGQVNASNDGWPCMTAGVCLQFWMCIRIQLLRMPLFSSLLEV